MDHTREGVLFHDGSLLTAEDVVFSLSPQRLLSEKWPGASAMKSLWSGVESVEAVIRSGFEAANVVIA